MATVHQIRDLITETTTGSVRPRVPREVRDEVCRYSVRRRKAGAAVTLTGGTIHPAPSFKAHEKNRTYCCYRRDSIRLLGE